MLRPSKNRWPFLVVTSAMLFVVVGICVADLVHDIHEFIDEF